MLVEDTSAFIEQLEVAEADRRVAKRRRRVTRARLEVLEVEWEVGLAAEALGTMERTLADLDRRQRADAMAKARAAILGEHVTATLLPPAPASEVGCQCSRRTFGAV